MMYKCATCGADIHKAVSQVRRSKTGNLYCSRRCAASNNNKLFKKWKNHPQYRTGRTAYRGVKLESVPNPKCERCGFDNILALVIHHRDRDRTNNTLENLEILCCNCHAIVHRTEYENVV